jgi:hypothetical protein
MEYRIILKGAIVLLLVSVLLFSNLSVATNIPRDSSTKINQSNEELIEPSSREEKSFKIQCYENFTCPTFPPKDYCGYGNWETDSRTNLEWNKSSINPKTKPFCAYVRTGIESQMEEWLISPSMNFSKINTRIYLEFSFKGNFRTAKALNNVDYNVMVSIDDKESWEPVWNENHILTNKYENWMDVKIELTKYSGYSNVLIGFQFITSGTKEWWKQHWCLDEILVYNESDIPLSISDGGPYFYKFDRQYDHFPWGVFLHGEIISNHSILDLTWHWDFGDQKTKTNYFSPHVRHYYEDNGTYNITLIVTHRKLGISTKTNTTLTFFEGSDNWLKVTVKEISIGIKAKIENLESRNATNVKWKIEVQWPPTYPYINRIAGDGTFDILEPDKLQNIQGTNPFLKFGSCLIVITVDAENIGFMKKEYNAFKIGQLYLVDPNPI